MKRPFEVSNDDQSIVTAKFHANYPSFRGPTFNYFTITKSALFFAEQIMKKLAMVAIKVDDCKDFLLVPSVIEISFLSAHEEAAPPLSL